MRSIVLITILCLALASAGAAQTKKPGSFRGSKSIEVTQKDLFSPAERHQIRSYLANQQRHDAKPAPRELPRGLQKKLARGKALPPGWQKKLARGRHLDYQVYRQGRPLPQELLTGLPAGPAGTELIQVAEAIIRVHTTSRTILDFFYLIQAAR